MVTLVIVAGSVASPSYAAPPPKDAKICRDIAVFGGARSLTVKNKTTYNRVASVQNVLCAAFGSSVRFNTDDGIVCTLFAAAVGKEFRKTGVFIDGVCAAPSIAANRDLGSRSSQACGVLSDLLGAAPVPIVKAYATAAGIACAFGRPFGEWLESLSERHAAQAIVRDPSQCLRYMTHHFPLGNTWDTIRCSPGDPGFSTLPKGPSHQGSRSTPPPMGSVGSPPSVDAPPSGDTPQPGPTDSPLPALAFRVMNADGGIYWRSSPDWNAAVASPGNGFYPDTIIQVTCYQSGADNVPGSSNSMWEQASWVSGQGHGSGWINEHFINDGAAINQPSPGAPPCATTPPPTQQPPPVQTWAETVGGPSHTWTNYTNAGGSEGPTIPAYTTVQIACKITGFRVADGNTWWYRIASSPWNSQYYVSADAFYNNGQTSGSLRGTPFVDPNVRDC
jgi:hypothetical protein